MINISSIFFNCDEKEHIFNKSAEHSGPGSGLEISYPEGRLTSLHNKLQILSVYSTIYTNTTKDMYV